MESAQKKLVVVTFMIAILVVGYTIVKWIRFDSISISAIFFSFITVSYFLTALTWGNHTSKKGSDELGKHIKAQSSKIAYYVLMFATGAVLFISEGTQSFNQITNYPLMIVVGLTFVVLPMTEFIYSRKYR
ncbi:hypothetical protein JFL43_08655 [Viridibacillus sp. YIM B01967]|uniref:Group-specific protein n=1 Tax=Viridibacillus soli TaxID=2798301 RepID=A0ABS1H690_9BACL|nr:hypothetical protein [Viridibacillus soli]MBK3494930.1 hypothetical protein [Viridibacillus soli]